MSDEPAIVQIHMPWPTLDGLTCCLLYLADKALELGVADDSWCFGTRRGVDVENDLFEMQCFREDCDCTCGAGWPKHDDSCSKLRGDWISARMDGCCGPPQHASDGFPLGRQIHFDRFEEWERANPCPACACGSESAFLAKHGLSKLPGDQYSIASNVEHEHACAWARKGRPEFTHKPSGFSVKWYKSIGRDLEPSRDITHEEWSGIFADCLRSIGAPVVTWQQAAKEARDEEMEDRKAFAVMVERMSRPRAP